MSSSSSSRDVTVIVAAAGAVPVPSWTLPLQDGRPALASVVERLDCRNVSRLIFVCLKEHVENKKETQTLARLLESVNPNLTGRVEVLQLDEPTKSGVDTIVTAIKKAKIEGGIFIKDADGAYDFQIPTCASPSGGSYCVCLKIHDNTVNTLSELTRKSFVQQCGGILTNIVEKKIISDTICVGGYSFESAADYVKHAEKLSQEVPASFFDASARKPGVLFNSDIILSLLAEQHVVSVKFVESFSDWKSSTGVVKFRESFSNIMVSFEEELCERSAQNGFHAIELMAMNEDDLSKNDKSQERAATLLRGLYTVNKAVADRLKLKSKESTFNKIVILTALPKHFGDLISNFLKENEVEYNQIVFDMFSRPCTRV